MSKLCDCHNFNGAFNGPYECVAVHVCNFCFHSCRPLLRRRLVIVRHSFLFWPVATTRVFAILAVLAVLAVFATNVTPLTFNLNLTYRHRNSVLWCLLQYDQHEICFKSDLGW